MATHQVRQYDNTTIRQYDNMTIQPVLPQPSRAACMHARGLHSDANPLTLPPPTRNLYGPRCSSLPRSRVPLVCTSLAACVHSWRSPCAQRYGSPQRGRCVDHPLHIGRPTWLYPARHVVWSRVVADATFLFAREWSPSSPVACGAEYHRPVHAARRLGRHGQPGRQTRGPRPIVRVGQRRPQLAGPRRTLPHGDDTGLLREVLGGWHQPAAPAVALPLARDLPGLSETPLPVGGVWQGVALLTPRLASVSLGLQASEQP